MGPSHPATHGTIKFNLKLEGEKVLACDVEVGFLHRGFDKSCEQATWTQVIPYTDRLNYASSLINNVGYALAVEKLIGAEDAAALPVHSRDRQRAGAHPRSSDLLRHGGFRTGRHYRRFLHDRSARNDYPYHRVLDRRAPDRDLCPHRRPQA